MKNPPASENSSAVSLFPFLAVLLCTMGALLVLLVVMAQHTGQRTVAEPSEEPPPAAEATLQTAEAAEQAKQLARELEAIEQLQAKLQQLRQQAVTRLQDEQQRLSHLEEHSRRIEHKLAKLALANKQLQAAENNQVVDQEQAEREMKSLQKLVAQTEAELEELRNQPPTQKSYAIVPYQGPHRTYRQPLFIECRQDEIILQPEGIRLTRADFAARNWPGNPLAAALRASREHLNARAAEAGQSEPPDPYPLLLVRPEGIGLYQVARAAIQSWDADFGYEFIDGDWKLEFPSSPDPELARVQHHAVLSARENLAWLAQAAPSRFRRQGIGQAGVNRAGMEGGFAGQGNGGAANGDAATGALSGSNSGTEGQAVLDGTDARYSGGEDRYSVGNPTQTDAASESVQLVAANQSGQPGSSADGVTGAPGSPAGPGQPGSLAGPVETNGNAPSGQAEGIFASDGSGGSLQRGQPDQGEVGGTDQSSNAASNAASGSAGASSSGQSPTVAGGGSPGEAREPPVSFSAAGGSGQSIAKSRGANWAIHQPSQRSSPIRRTIRLVVRENQLAVLPNRHVLSGLDGKGVTISLQQPSDKVAQELFSVLQDRIDSWGLAGTRLYWRPVLALSVGPNAQRPADKVVDLLKDSGVEVRLPQTAQRWQEARADAIR